MAITIPRYDEQQVKSVGIATPRAQGASADSFGAGIGQGLQRAGQDMGSFARDMQQEELQTKAYDFRVKLDEHENAIKFGDPGDGGSEGFLKIEGSESMQYLKTYLDDFKTKALEAIPQDVPQHIRTQFEKMAMERYNSLSNEFNRHAMAQESKANDAATGAMQASILRNIGSNAFDDNRFQLELGTLKHVVSEGITKKYGEDNPEADQIRTSAVELAVNDAYSKRLNSMLDDPSKAKQFLDDNTNVGTLTPDVVAHFNHLLQPKLEARAAIDIVTTAKAGLPPTNPDEPLDIEKAYQLAQKDSRATPENLKLVYTQLEHDKKLHDQAQTDKFNYNYGQLVDMWESNPNLTQADVMLNPAFGNLTTVQQGNAMAKIRQKIEQRNSTERSIVASERSAGAAERAAAEAERANRKREAQGRYYALARDPKIIASMTDEEFKAAKFNIGDDEQAMHMEELRKRVTSKEALRDVNAHTQIVTNVLDSGLGVDDAQKGSILARVNRNIAKFQTQNKRIATDEEAQNITLKAAQFEFVQEAGMFGSKTIKRGIDVQPTDKVIPFPDKIPAEISQRIDALETKRGAKFTPERRQAIYEEIKKGGK